MGRLPTTTLGCGDPLGGPRKEARGYIYIACKGTQLEVVDRDSSVKWNQGEDAKCAEPFGHILLGFGDSFVGVDGSGKWGGVCVRVFVLT